VAARRCAVAGLDGGLVALFGITLRNSILIVAHYDRLVRIEGRPWAWTRN